MIELKHPLGVIKVPGKRDSLRPLAALAKRATVWGADTETTGLNMYASGFGVRIVQVGTRDEAWILRPDWHMEAIEEYTAWTGPKLLGQKTWWHNWVFDGLSMEQSLGVDFDATFAAAHDTDILSRLYDPRPPQKGGVGHKLKDLGDKYVMRGVKDARDVLLAHGKKLFGAREFTKDNMWTKIPIDDPVYLAYAGQDVFIAARLAEVLLPKVEEKGIMRFATYERQLSRRLAEMQRRGIAFDPEWAAEARAEYMGIFEQYEGDLKEVWKVPPTKSSGMAHTARAALIQRFTELGAPPWEKVTDKGGVSLDKSVVGGLTISTNTDVAEMANALRLAGRNKHYAGYIDGMTTRIGTDGRLHPNVRPMQAATHRMSIADPPIQQFPRDDPWVRGCLIADPGHVIITADYAQIEYRVAAAVSQDPEMIRMIKAGEDLHGVAAAAVFGEGFNKGQRQACKPIGLGRLYLGGANGIWTQMAESDTTGYLPTLAQVTKGAKAFDRKFRVYNKYALGLKTKVERAGGRLTTATGRKLIVEPAYAAANYNIQSTARDLFAAAITRIHQAGYGSAVRLVVHDEIVLSVPKRSANKMLREVTRIMTTEFLGVPIEVEPEIKGARWAK